MFGTSRRSKIRRRPFFLESSCLRDKKTLQFQRRPLYHVSDFGDLGPPSPVQKYFPRHCISISYDIRFMDILIHGYNVHRTATIFAEAGDYSPKQRKDRGLESILRTTQELRCMILDDILQNNLCFFMWRKSFIFQFCCLK